MAKYDEFGRPIYETAEEYNKARKTGSASRTYESPEGDSYQHNTYKQTKKYEKAAERYQKQAGSKKGKKLILILVCVILVTQIAAVFVMFRTTSGIYDMYEENWYEEDWIGTEKYENSGYGEYIGDDTQPLPEGFNTFSYNGVTYTLPTTYQEIAKMGFFLEEEYDESYTFPAEYEELLNLNDADGYLAGMIRVNNHTDEDLPLEQCIVDYLYLGNDAAYSDEEIAPDFVFGDNLSFESSYEELEAYFGLPYYHYEDHEEEGYYYDNYEWSYYGEGEIHFVSITFWNGVISDISIEKKAYEPKY
ncbi:MAG: hypothetical protein IJ455_00755 [Agathobacter sp.]|nr:hypothetical protein [Agathobacter sp.]